MKGRKNGIKMGENEKSKSRTSRYTNFETPTLLIMSDNNAQQNLTFFLWSHEIQ